MQVTLNDKEFTFPSSLAEYTLGQRIDFQNQYGNELDEMMKSIIAMEEGSDKELEITRFQFEKCFRTFAFFAGVDPEVLKASEYVDTIANIYFTNTQTLLEEEEKFELNLSYEWNGDIWEIHPPSLKQGSRMTFGEFVDSKQAIKDMIALGKGQWENLLPLAAIYFRKKDEAYDESFLYEDSGRLKLMRELPLNMAMSVGFFLTSSLNFALNTLQSSFPPVVNRADFQRSISNYGAGSTF